MKKTIEIVQWLNPNKYNMMDYLGSCSLTQYADHNVLGIFL